MKSTDDKVCLTHTDRPATTRCETCFRPLCDECIIKQEGTAFCSETCAANYSESRERIDTFRERQQRDIRRRRLHRLTWLIILGLLAAVAVIYAKKHPRELREIRQRIERALPK